MIPITPEIIGPDIEEEYHDATVAITDLRRILGAQELINSTPEGRLLLKLHWVEQVIQARQLAIPVDLSFVGTIYYLVGSNELGNYAGFSQALGRLWLVLKGYGLMKARHVAVLISMIEDVLAEAATVRGQLPESNRRLMEELAGDRDVLKAETGWPAPRPPQQGYYPRSSEVFEKLVSEGWTRLSDIDNSLFDGWRPRPARKPPLPAPVPGLPPQAPELPASLEGRAP